MIINRELLKIELKSEPISNSYFDSIFAEKQQELNITKEEMSYFVFVDKVENQAYDASKSKINIYFKNEKIEDITNASDQLNIQALTKPVVKYFIFVVKYFICYPKK